MRNDMDEHRVSEAPFDAVDNQYDEAVRRRLEAHQGQLLDAATNRIDELEKKLDQLRCTLAHRSQEVSQLQKLRDQDDQKVRSAVKDADAVRAERDQALRLAKEHQKASASYRLALLEAYWILTRGEHTAKVGDVISQALEHGR